VERREQNGNVVVLEIKVDVAVTTRGRYKSMERRQNNSKENFFLETIRILKIVQATKLKQNKTK